MCINITNTYILVTVFSFIMSLNNGFFIQVHKVITGSIADRDARVLRGDRVLSINGKSTRGLTHREALTLLKVQ